MPGVYYVSDSGDGNGTLDDPYSLETALNIGIPGDIFYLRGGTYSSITHAPTGQLDNLVTYRNYPGERVIIDGYIAGGIYCKFQGIEVTDTTSFAEGRTSDWPVNQGTTGVTVGYGNEYYYIHVKNHQQGFDGGQAMPYKLHGCIGQYCGLDNSYGHFCYLQHKAGYGQAILSQCIGVFNFGYDYHFYGSWPYHDLDVQDCISVQSGLIRASATPGFILNGNDENVNVSFLRNLSYKSAGGAGFYMYGNNDLISNVTFQNNVCHGQNAASFFQNFNPDNPVTGNQFYGTLGEFTADEYPDNDYGAIGELPDQTHLVADTYDSNRATLIIYNMQAQANTLAVDVSAVFGQSGVVKAHNPQDYFVDIQELTIVSGIITINMQAVNRTVEMPVGWAAPDTTFPDFGCFILELQ